jgi:hypothetical protein
LHNIIGALIWLIIGYIVARVVRAILTKGLRAIHFDQITDRAGIGRALQAAGTKLDAAAVLAAVAFWWIFLYFIENAFTVLGFSQATLFINQVLGYLPNVLAAILIIIVGALIANVAAGIVRGASSEAGSLMGSIARWAIILFAVLSALTQLNIAPNMIFILFAGIVSMLAIAGGIAFGLGGVDAARNLVNSQSSQAAGALSAPGDSRPPRQAITIAYGT